MAALSLRRRSASYGGQVSRGCLSTLPAPAGAALTGNPLGRLCRSAPWSQRLALAKIFSLHRLHLFANCSNIWLALALSKHTHHRAARAWLEGQPESASLCFCRVTQQGLVRLLTTAEVLAGYGNPPPTNRRAWRKPGKPWQSATPIHRNCGWMPTWPFRGRSNRSRICVLRWKTCSVNWYCQSQESVPARARLLQPEA